MARLLGPVCRLCRAEGMKLFLKGTRCHTEKCAIERREYAPGMHGQNRRSKTSDFGMQLREKQKVKRLYGIMERQFRFYFRKASRAAGATGAQLLRMLERRLDNVVYRAGFASTRRASRQLVTHGWVTVNDRRVTIPNFQVRAGDTVRIRASDDQLQRVRKTREFTKEHAAVDWLDIDDTSVSAVVKRLPERSDVQFPIQEQQIVELYSK